MSDNFDPFFPCRLGSRTYLEVQEYLRKNDLILVPIGSHEQHGPSCPLFTDILIAESIALRVASELELLVGPAINLGDSIIHLDYPGTISIRPSVMIQYVADYVRSLHHSGFRRLLFVNGHSDNTPILLATLSELGGELRGLRYIVKDFWDFPRFRDLMKKYFNDEYGGHADETDASMLWAFGERYVRPDKFVDGYPSRLYRISRDLVRDLYTTTGVICGDQRLSSPQIGEQLIEESIAGYRHEVRLLADIEPYEINIHKRPE
jgi:creatinine amidohydrolase